MSREVIESKEHPEGGCYLAREGQLWYAGRSLSTARAFQSVQAVVDAFLPLADTQVWAWNICYLIEDFEAE